MNSNNILNKFLLNKSCENTDITCRITNNISLIIGFVSLFAYIILVLKILLMKEPYILWDIERLVFLSISGFAAYFLHNKGFKVIGKLIIIFSVLLFVVFYPVLVGQLTPDITMLYPVFIILLATFSQLIFNFEKEKPFYIFSLVFLLISLYYTDIIYDYFNPNIRITDLLGSDLFVVKLGYIVVFTVINYTIYFVLKKYKYSLNQIQEFSEKINEKNSILEQNNIELKEYKEEIQIQNEELQTYLEEIRAQRDRIEEKNDDILKSITYARRIQKSLIPQSKILYSFFDDYFILNQPKDILSGDFYWTNTYEDKVVLAVADCTGHGVPAALLSVLGISMLTEISLKYKGLNAGEILDHLKLGIITALSHSSDHDNTKDGMDISLIIFDKNKMNIEYAGAFNPFVVIRDNEIISIDADRMPVGICEINKTFTNHNFKVNKDDIIYLFSDGFVDQFGGSDNKKIKRRRFKELLISTSTIPLPVQKEQINIFFKKWKGENEQVDDVLLIGLKV